MSYSVVKYLDKNALDLADFRDMDYYTIENFNISIELMMENAGLQLANLIAGIAQKQDTIRIGVGNGNNGGGGLVASRRLAAWGYHVFIDPFTEISKDLPETQLKRAQNYGVKITKVRNPDIWIDAYLGFSQRLPLDKTLSESIEEANKSSAVRVSLDIPTGFLGKTDTLFFRADKILTLAAPKKILSPLIENTEIYMADLGIPKEVYFKFGIEMPPFHKSNILKLIP